MIHIINNTQLLLLRLLATCLRATTNARSVTRNEGGFTTAELLGNAALGILALVVIWGLMRELGVNVVGFIQDQLTG